MTYDYDFYKFYNTIIRYFLILFMSKLYGKGQLKLFLIRISSVFHGKKMTSFDKYISD